MSTSVTFNGTSYTIPAIADSTWGTAVANYLIAISTGCLQKTGGAFTLTAEANFGATYGIKACYLKSYTTNPASAGAVRLAKSDLIYWRNNANGADVGLGISASDFIQWAGVDLVDKTTAQTLTNKTLTAPTLTTPALGVATATSINGLVLSSSTGTFTLANGKTLTVSNTLTFTGTDSSSVAFGAGGTVLYSGGALGTPSSGTLTNCTGLPIAGGGSGQTTANAALNAFLPSQTSNSGKVLSTDGSNASWASAASSTLNQFNTDIGDSSNTRQGTNTNLLGDVKASSVSATYAVTNAVPGVFTVSGHGLATGDKAYVTVTQNGFTANTTYFVAKIDANTFKLSTTLANAVAGTCITSSGTTAGTVVTGGFVLTSGVKGTVTNDNAVTGYVGEYLENVRSSATATITTNTYTSVDSGNSTFNDGNETGVTLTAGDWDLEGLVTFAGASGALMTQLRAFIGTAKGNSTTGLDTRNSIVLEETISASATVPLVIPNYRVSISATTTYYLKARVIWGTGTVTATGFINARRVR